MNTLKQKSIQVILDNQAESGAFVASPNFETYNYCWFRDGAYIAYAADLMGNFSKTEKFHLWCADVIERYREVAENAIYKINNNEKTTEHDFLPTRFSLEGISVEDDWTNFQLDGFGTWLWSLSEHIKLAKDDSIISKIKPAIKITVEYLIACWQVPCYDCWEEHLDFIHPYTLGSISAGISSMRPYLKELESEIDTTVLGIKEYLDQNAIKEDQIIKMIPIKEDPSEKSLGVDSSLIAMFEPYHLYSGDSDVACKTLNRIEKDIYRNGAGVYRYLEDTYYGGGEWLLLTAWLGWFYAKNDQKEKAKQLKLFIESKADGDLLLAEQVFDQPLHPEMYQHWVDMWGENAKPLLWSHAMYIILDEALKE